MTPLSVVSGNCPEFSGPRGSCAVCVAALGSFQVAVSPWN